MGYQQIATVYKDVEDKRMGRIDKLFMVHKQVVSSAGTVYFDWADFLQMADAGVEMWNIHDFGCERCGRDLPFKHYPLDEIIDKFDLGYFSDTICYQIAFALHEATEGRKKDHNLKLKYPLKIRLYGVDLQDKEEYGEEKGGVECWIGYALGLGADVTISHGSTLLLTNNGAPYGFDVVSQKMYDPYSLLAKKYPPADGSDRMNEDEFKEHFDEIISTIEDMTKEIFPDYAKYQGEGASGLHRENIPVLGLTDDTTS
ncbi:MAG: hypothetical protein IMZ61_06425 [Planctomycetes bacterium]|nr:hypothetical protein [Planctomycetota bacterium]